MYIEPTSNIYLCSGVPLDPSYEHTLYFSTIQSAADYFLTKAVKTFNHQSYQRVRRGWLRIKANAEELAGVNYLAFNNGLLHGSVLAGKWWFAFVTNVEYINENTTEIAYQLDVLTSYIGRYELAQTFVEREHSATDIAGDNTQPEDVELGEYVYQYGSKWGVGAHGFDLVVASTVDYEIVGEGQAATMELVDAEPGWHNGVFSSLALIRFTGNSMGDQLAQFISKLESEHASGVNAIVAMFLLPSEISEHINDEPTQPYKVSHNFNRPISFDGYTPRNNKLLTYPYACMFVEDGNGHAQEYRYEFFPNAQPRFRITAVAGIPPEVSLFPYNYAVTGTPTGSDAIARTKGIRITDFPQVAWASDAYQAWLAQNRIHNELQTSGSLAMATFAGGKFVAANSALINSVLEGMSSTQIAMMGTVLPGVAPSLAGVASGIAMVGSLYSAAQSIGTRHVASTLPKMVKGQAGIGQLDMANGDFGVYFWHVHLRREYIEKIDQFFDRYGYATNSVKVPNTHVRPHWTYTKTNGCSLINNHVPASDAEKICKIFDKGITFWVNPSEVGNYSLDNSPATPSNEGGDNNGTTSPA